MALGGKGKHRGVVQGKRRKHWDMVLGGKSRCWGVAWRENGGI